MNDLLTLGDVADRLQVSLALVRKLARAAELAAEVRADYRNKGATMYEIEQVREAITPSEMRIEIARLRWHNCLVRASMDSADYTGLSAEDRYTMLAYHVLVALEKTQKAMHECLSMMSGPHLVMPNTQNQPVAMAEPF
jgi:hypothetical protein